MILDSDDSRFLWLVKYIVAISSASLSTVPITVSAEVIHEVQDTKPPPRAERIRHEVHRPHLVRCHCLGQRLAHPAALPPALAPQRQLFLDVLRATTNGREFVVMAHPKGASILP